MTYREMRELQRKIEVDYFNDLLSRHGWIISSAAVEANVHRNSLYKRLHRIGFYRKGRSYDRPDASASH
jgi:DNA-binding NtrC family response regulator